MSGDGDTRWGFIWGVAKVARVMQYRGSRILAIDTLHRHLEISISPTGRSVRVWRDGKELS